jgi:two-component system LytT family response regulator
MLRAIIIDDESSGVESLELLLKAKFSADVKVVAITTDPLKGLEMIGNFHPDVVFLDINMPEMNGFELLSRVDYKGFHLVFITAYTQYGLQALKQQPVDYLLKPVSNSDMAKVIIKIKSRNSTKANVRAIYEQLKNFHHVQNLKIAIPNKSGIENVYPNDIVYIEADGASSKIHLQNDQTIIVPRLLKEYEQMLCVKDFPFIRIHNSFVVNVNYVSRYVKEDGGYVVMKNRKKISVSKPKKQEFFRMISLGGEED